MRPRLLIAAAAWLVVCHLLAYGFDIGKGFVKDDFVWIRTSRVARVSDVVSLFQTAPTGFFRPVVSLSFALNERLFSLNPAGYAATNLLLAYLTAAAIAGLARALGLSPAASLFAAALWAFNVHGINMALLWISGRTSLIATLMSCLAAVAFARRWSVAAGVLVLAALLSKEEPILLPLVFAIWAFVDVLQARKAGGRTIVPGGGPEGPYHIDMKRWGPSLVALVAYLALRSQTSAFTTSTAPEYYRLEFSARTILENVFQYADRSLTFAAGALLIGAVLFIRRRITLTDGERVILLKGAVWLVLTFALTVLLPVRSSLYVLLPGVGSALMAAALGQALWRSIPERRHSVALAGVFLLPLLLLPLYRARNVRMRQEAELSTIVLSMIRSAAAANPALARVVVVDDINVRPSATAAFGTLLEEAVAVSLARPLPVVLIPDVSGSTEAAPNTLRLLVSGRSVRSL